MVSLKSWRNLGQLVADDVAEMAATPITVSRGYPAHFTADAACATIAMSLPAEQLELRVSVVADPAAMAWIAETLLHDSAARDSAVRDALRELANTAGGALKRAALTETITLTTGIPLDDSAARFPGQNCCWNLALSGGSGSLALVGEIRIRRNQRVSAEQLSEGMVLAHDIRSEGGVLIVPAGSRLTATSANRLAAMLGPRYLLEVAPPA